MYAYLAWRDEPQSIPFLETAARNVKNGCKMLDLWSKVTNICRERHPNTDPCFSIADFDIKFNFPAGSFLNPNCPAIKYYNKIFGRLNLAQVVTKADQLTTRQYWIVKKGKRSEIIRDSRWNGDLVYANHLEQSMRSISIFCEIDPAVNYSTSKEKKLDKQFRAALEEYDKLIQGISSSFPRIFGQMIDCYSRILDICSRMYRSDLPRVELLKQAGLEATELIKTFEAKIELIDEVCHFDERLKTVLQRGDTNCTLIECYSEFVARQPLIIGLSPFCDVSYYREISERFKGKITEMAEEEERDGDISISEGDLTENSLVKLCISDTSS